MQARSAAIGAALNAQAAEAGGGGGGAAPSDACPGLAASDVDALTRGNPALDSAALCRQKLALLALISAAGDSVPPQACVLHLQAACCDSNGSVASAADTLLRKKCGLDSAKPDVDVEDRALLARVFTLLLGSNGAGGPAGAAAAAVGGGAVTQPASYPLQVRLLRMCCKSIAAANFFPQSLQVRVPVDRFTLVPRLDRLPRCEPAVGRPAVRRPAAEWPTSERSAVERLARA